MFPPSLSLSLSLSLSRTRAHAYTKIIIIILYCIAAMETSRNLHNNLHFTKMSHFLHLLVYDI